MLQRILQWARSIWPRIFSWAKGFEFLVRFIVPVASIVIAIFAYKIQTNLISQEKERAAISRSIVLYEQFMASESAKYLLDSAHEIQIYLSLPHNKVKIKEALVNVFGEEEFYEKREDIRKHLADLLKNVNSIYRCGLYGENLDENDDKVELDNAGDIKSLLCDRHTISVLFGEQLSEIFYMIRPVLYCDEFMRATYFDGDPDSSIGKFESLIMDHLVREVGGKTYEVFRTDVHRRDVEHSGDYRVVRLPEVLERCGPYRQKPVK